MTITENAYNINASTGKFDMKNPLIKHDLENPKSPKTVFGYISECLN